MWYSIWFLLCDKRKFCRAHFKHVQILKTVDLFNHHKSKSYLFIDLYLKTKTILRSTICKNQIQTAVIFFFFCYTLRKQRLIHSSYYIENGKLNKNLSKNEKKNLDQTNHSINGIICTTDNVVRTRWLEC